MDFKGISRNILFSASILALTGCGGGIASGDSGLFRRSSDASVEGPDRIEGRERQKQNTPLGEARSERRNPTQSSLADLFVNPDEPNTTVEVNKYLWNAALDVLNFLPIQQVDPFSGLIVTGYGTPPGGGRAYRATIHISDPALDARGLKLALATQSGPVDPDTVRAVEDAILTRARQLRIRDSKL